MKLLLIPQSGFSVQDGALYTVNNRGQFYSELSAKYKKSTILYTISQKRNHDENYKMDNKNLVCLKDYKDRKLLLLTFYQIKVFFRLITTIIAHDVVVVIVPNKTAVLASFIGKLFNKIVIAYVAGDWPKLASIPYKKKHINRATITIKYCLNVLFEYIAVRSATHVFVAGRDLFKRLENYNKSIEEIIPMIAFQADDIFIREDTFQSDTINILYVGYLTKLKGIQYLFDAFIKIKHEYPYSILNVVGDGELFSDLNKYPCSDIIFYSHISEKNELRKLYMIADVFIFPSLSEGFPRVLYEAMMHSLPIITTDVGGIKHFFQDGVDALLIPAKNIEEIIQKFRIIANEKELRKNLINNANKKVASIFYLKTSEQFDLKIKQLKTTCNC